MRADVILGDCLDVMRTMPAMSVDAVVTDPPYANVGTGVSRVSKTRGIPDERQFFEAWLSTIWAECARVLKPSGALWMTIDWRGAVSCERVALSSPLSFAGVGVWNRGGMGMGFALRHVYECFVFARMPSWQRTLTDEIDVWEHQWSPGHRTFDHEAEKPTVLFARALRLIAPPPGGTVLDPFCGSGSTGVAANAEGFDFVGIEREAEYVEIARRRIANVAPLFSPLPGGRDGGRG